MPKKRGQNEGAIYQRKDGRWEASMNHGYVERQAETEEFLRANQG